MFQQKRDTDTPAAGDAVQQARTRARRRLIGAAVLLGIGVVGFPLVFETQPRPIPVDIPIEIPKKDGLPPLATPPPPSTRPAEPAVITESREEAGREVVVPARPAPSVAAATAAASRPPATLAAASAPRPASSAPRVASADDGDRARALLEGRDPRATEARQARAAASPSVPATTAPAAPSAADGARFVVQVGAFADADSARDARTKVEKLGLKTYTQVAETPGGKRTRVRVGPFASREDAEVVLAKVKAGGLAAVVLTL